MLSEDAAGDVSEQPFSVMVIGLGRTGTDSELTGMVWIGVEELAVVGADELVMDGASLE